MSASPPPPHPRVKPKVQKNIERDKLGTKLGRIHMERQDYDRLQTRKIKALKITKVQPQGSLLDGGVCGGEGGGWRGWLNTSLALSGPSPLPCCWRAFPPRPSPLSQKRRAEDEAGKSGAEEDGSEDEGAAPAGAGSGGGGEGRRAAGLRVKALRAAGAGAGAGARAGDDDDEDDGTGYASVQATRSSKRRKNVN